MNLYVKSLGYLANLVLYKMEVFSKEVNLRLDKYFLLIITCVSFRLTSLKDRGSFLVVFVVAFVDDEMVEVMGDGVEPFVQRQTG